MPPFAQLIYIFTFKNAHADKLWYVIIQRTMQWIADSFFLSFFLHIKLHTFLW